MREKRIAHNDWELAFYEMALKASGRCSTGRGNGPQYPVIRRMNPAGFDTGYIYSFNGPHSLFSDTIRSVRSSLITARGR